MSPAMALSPTAAPAAATSFASYGVSSSSCQLRAVSAQLSPTDGPCGRCSKGGYGASSGRAHTAAAASRICRLMPGRSSLAAAAAAAGHGGRGSRAFAPANADAVVAELEAPAGPLADWQKWRTLEDQPLTAETLQQLFNNEIVAIRIKDFASAEECEQIVAVIQELDRQNRSHRAVFKPQILGAAFGDRKRQATYFEENKAAQYIHDMLAEKAFCPGLRIMDIIRTECNMSVRAAEHPEFGPYPIQGIRQVKLKAGIMSAHMHFAPFDGRGWPEVSNVDAQLAWNLYVKVPKTGGNSVIYNWPGQLEDETMYKQPVFGRIAEAVARAREAKEHDRIVGDVIIMNSRNYHMVRESIGGRVTITGLIGRLPDDLKTNLFWV